MHTHEKQFSQNMCRRRGLASVAAVERTHDDERFHRPRAPLGRLVLCVYRPSIGEPCNAHGAIDSLARHVTVCMTCHRNRKSQAMAAAGCWLAGAAAQPPSLAQNRRGMSGATHR